MKDNNGQVSLEFLMLFSIFLLFLITFTLPLTETSIKNNLELEEAISIKYELSKLANGITQIYNQGQGSKKTIILDLKHPISITINNNSIWTRFFTSDLNYKYIKFDILYNGVSKTLTFDKGINKIIISWPINSEGMIIDKK